MGLQLPEKVVVLLAQLVDLLIHNVPLIVELLLILLLELAVSLLKNLFVLGESAHELLLEAVALLELFL